MYGEDKRMTYLQAMSLEGIIYIYLDVKWAHHTANEHILFVAYIFLSWKGNKWKLKKDACNGETWINVIHRTRNELILKENDEITENDKAKRNRFIHTWRA